MSEAGASAEGGEGAGETGESSWRDSIEDAELKGWVENKNFSDPGTMADSYRNLERLFGHDKAGRTVVLPGENPSEGDMNEFYGKLGRPETPQDYNIDVPEGEDPAFAEFAKGMFHEVGLNQQQAKAMAEKWGNYVNDTKHSMEDSYQSDVEVADKKLKQNWGQQYDKNIAVAQNAVKVFGIGEEQIDSLEKALGYGDLMSMMYNIGSKLNEDSFIDGNSEGDFGGLSKEAAMSQISDLKLDSAFRTKLINGDKDAQGKWDRLHRVAHGS